MVPIPMQTISSHLFNAFIIRFICNVLSYICIHWYVLPLLCVLPVYKRHGKSLLNIPLKSCYSVSMYVLCYMHVHGRQELSNCIQSTYESSVLHYYSVLYSLSLFSSDYNCFHYQSVAIVKLLRNSNNPTQTCPQNSEIYF